MTHLRLPTLCTGLLLVACSAERAAPAAPVASDSARTTADSAASDAAGANDERGPTDAAGAADEGSTTSEAGAKGDAATRAGPAPAEIAPDPERWREIRAWVRREFPGVRHVGVEAFARELEERPGAHVLFDVRAEAEYEVSHLPGAVRAESTEAALAHLQAREAGLDRTRAIVVYCSVGYRSSRLATALAAEGFTNVRNLEGSIFAWANAGHALVRDGAEVREVHPFDGDWGELLLRELRSDL